MSARVVTFDGLWCGRRRRRDGRLFFIQLREEAAAVVCHGLGRGRGFNVCLSLCLREGELVVHEAPQADAYCYERRHRAAHAAR